MVAWQVVSKGGQSVSSSKNRVLVCTAPTDWTNTNKMLNLRGWAQNSPRKVSLFCQFCCTFAIEHQKGRTAHAIYHIAKCVSHAPNMFFFVPRKVRFLAMTNVRASSTLFIWLNENVLFRSSKSAFSHHDNVWASSTPFIWLNENVPNHMAKATLTQT